MLVLELTNLSVITFTEMQEGEKTIEPMECIRVARITKKKATYVCSRLLQLDSEQTRCMRIMPHRVIILMLISTPCLHQIKLPTSNFVSSHYCIAL